MEKCKENEILKANNKEIIHSEQINLIQSIKYINSINKIFSYLIETKKLYLIIYNKEIKNRLKIDIDYYKKISGRYKIGENNGLGEEYKLNTNILLFKGEYLNKKRKSGIEYDDNGEVIFAGTYLNGKKWNGIGKEYYENNFLKFEGEYKNGLRNGNGKEYFDYNKFISLFELSEGKNGKEVRFMVERIYKKTDEEYKDLFKSIQLDFDKLTMEYLCVKKNKKIKGNKKIIFEGYI